MPTQLDWLPAASIALPYIAVVEFSVSESVFIKETPDDFDDCPDIAPEQALSEYNLTVAASLKEKETTAQRVELGDVLVTLAELNVGAVMSFV